MKWSQLKKRITSFLAPAIKDRIDIGFTAYRKAHDRLGRGWIKIDKTEILNMPTLAFEMEQYRLTHVAQINYTEAAAALHARNLFSQDDLVQSLFSYLNLSIDAILGSDNPIIRAVGMLDARVGIQRLRKLDLSNEHELVKRLYYLRCEAEHIALPEQNTALLSTRITYNSPLAQEKPDREKTEKTALERLNRAKRTRAIASLIRRIHRGEISEEELDTELSRDIFAGFTVSTNRERLHDFLLFVEAKTKLLQTVKHTKGVMALARESEDWLRPYETWRPTSHNPDLQFSSLARHLWVRYEVPEFMDHAWVHGNIIHQNWFKHIGSGKSIRTAPNLPVPLTKKMAHHFLQAPPYFPIEAAIRWGQVHALDGNAQLAEALLDTRLVRDFSHDEFWLSVLRFFIRNPMLDPVHINPMIDYIWDQRFQNRVIFVEQGVAEEVGPVQPNFSMNGRTVDALLHAVERWHQQLGKETKSGNLQWQRSGPEDFQFVEGSKESRNMKIWKIRELLSSAELVAEGRQMKHCVATYAQSCHKGICSIWAMEVETESGLEKAVTIEVQNHIKQIRQVRGRMNRRPTEKEKDILTRWALQVGLEVGGYV